MHNSMINDNENGGIMVHKKKMIHLSLGLMACVFAIESNVLNAGRMASYPSSNAPYYPQDRFSSPQDAYSPEPYGRYDNRYDDRYDNAQDPYYAPQASIEADLYPGPDARQGRRDDQDRLRGNDRLPSDPYLAPRSDNRSRDDRDALQSHDRWGSDSRSTQQRNAVPPAAKSSLKVHNDDRFDSGASGWQYRGKPLGTSELNFKKIGKFLGNAGKTGDVPVTKKIKLENPGKFVKISFDVLKIDSWDDEKFEFKINQTLMASLLFKLDKTEKNPYIVSSTENKNLGFRGEWSDQIHHFEYIFRNTGTHLISQHPDKYEDRVVPYQDNELYLGFYSYQDQGIDDESWGLDNVRITSADTLEELSEKEGSAA